MKILGASFFDRSPLVVAPDLLGKYLVYQSYGGPVGGIVVETEAYTHDDPAFHAWGVVDAPTGEVKPTGRAYDLFGPPGRSYVYLCYGKYWLLNVLTQREGIASCVLIRSLEPKLGVDQMWQNRPNITRLQGLCNGPGKLTLAMGIDKASHRTDLTRPPLFFSDEDALRDVQIASSSRIGITRAVDRPWRFYIEDSRFVSPGITSDIAATRRRKAQHGKRLR